MTFLVFIGTWMLLIFIGIPIAVAMFVVSIGYFLYTGIGINFAAQRVVDAYPVGQSVMVLVDPADPAKTWLEVRRSIGAMILLGFGGLWIGIGVMLVGLSFL